MRHSHCVGQECPAVRDMADESNYPIAYEEPSSKDLQEKYRENAKCSLIDQVYIKNSYRLTAIKRHSVLAPN